jgi:uncharacterized protein (TIGR02466 family)
MPAKRFFPTLVYQEPLSGHNSLNRQLLEEIEDISALDAGGLKWSKRNYPNGFTSYASANELHRSSSTFSLLAKKIDQHVARFASLLELELGGRPLVLTKCWVNVMDQNSHHGLHLHPLSVISGTYYVRTPRGSSGLKFEDPRLGLFMGSPPRKESCRAENRQFVEVAAKEGNLVLFESWLRHEVPLQAGREPRVSVSFNYGWGD